MHIGPAGACELATIAQDEWAGAVGEGGVGVRVAFGVR
jgi:hypothetical protein